MSILDLQSLRQSSVQRTPYDHLVVPGFVKAEALADVNRDFPEIDQPGNMALDGLRYGPGFDALIEELRGSEFQTLIGEKFGMDLGGRPIEVTVRKFSEASDGHIHTDSRSKKLTMLIYFNSEWPHEGGKLRILRSAEDIDDFAAEVPPVRGTMVAFRRCDWSYHGFKSCEAERRSMQIHWLDPKKVGGRQRKRQENLLRRVKRAVKRRFKA